jgi:hypothetical protein
MNAKPYFMKEIISVEEASVNISNSNNSLLSEGKVVDSWDQNLSDKNLSLETSDQFQGIANLNVMKEDFQTPNDGKESLGVTEKPYFIEETANSTNFVLNEEILFAEENAANTYDQNISYFTFPTGYQFESSASLNVTKQVLLAIANVSAYITRRSLAKIHR